MSQLSTDPMQDVPITLKERRPFALRLKLVKRDGTPLSTQSSFCRLVIADVKRKGGAVKITKNGTGSVTPEDGIFRFDIQGDDLNFGVGTYDMTITLITGDGFEATIVDATVQLTHNPDPAVPDDYTNVLAPLELTARFRDQNRITVKVDHVPDDALLEAVEHVNTVWGATTLSKDLAEAAAASAATSAAEADAARDQAAALQLEIDTALTDAVAAASAAADADAAAAAASAAAAAASAAAASGSATTASSARDQAQAAEVAAETAETNATTAWQNAENSATWASTQAGTAEGHAIDAQVAASQADASADAAAASAAEILAIGYMTGVGITRVEAITQAAYDALAVKVNTTLYVIVG